MPPLKYVELLSLAQQRIATRSAAARSVRVNGPLQLRDSSTFSALRLVLGR